MATFRCLLQALFLLCLLPFYQLHVHAQSPPPTDGATLFPCPTPTGFANTIVRAPLPASPTLHIKDPFLYSHILFSITDLNTALPQSSFASFCLDQCIAYQPNPNATLGGKGPCLSFTVDMGKPTPGAPTDGNATATRWWCEGFDAYLQEDLSDYVEADTEGSYMYGLGVNRACGGGYRAY